MPVSAPPAPGGPALQAPAARPAGGGCGPCRLTGRRRWGLRFVLLVLAPVVMLSLVEGGLRLAGYGYPTDFLVTTDDGRTWSPNKKFAWRFCPRAAASEPDSFLLACPKPEGTVRVFILGESAAMGTPDPAYSFGRVLEVMLRARHPGVKFQVLNAALADLGSHAIRDVAADCAQHGADIMVVYMGNNEVVGPWSPFTSPLPGGNSLALTRAALWARSLRLGQGACAVLERLGATRDLAGRQSIETFLACAVRPDDPRLRGVEQNLRANLGDICRTATRAGARVVVATVATNLKDCAPLASLHRAGLAPAERSEWETAVLRGEGEETVGRLTSAVDHYRRAMAIDDRFADLHFRLARCLLALGRAEEAREHYVAARDLDALPFRTTSALNRVIRETAGGRLAEGIALVDAARALERCPESPQGIPGESLFCEHACLTFEGNYRLAEAVLPAVEGALPEPHCRTAAAPVPSIDRCAEQLVLTRTERLRMALATAAAMAKPPFTAQSNHPLRQARLQHLIDELSMPESASEQEHEDHMYLAAIGNDPDDAWRLHLKCGLKNFERGEYAKAASHWRRVLETFPDHVEARVRLGETLERLGGRSEAMAEYRKALSYEPRCERACRNLTAALVAEGRVDEAIACVEQLVKEQPDPGIWRVLGNLYARRGKLDRAIAHWTEGLARFRDDAGLHEALASALMQQERYAEAVPHFEAALRQEPEHVMARCGLALALEHLGRHEEAEVQFRLARTVNPTITPALQTAAPGQ